MSKLILVRHGQSEWNKKNLFTGWVDIPLSSTGVEEALKAGLEIKNISIDVIFTSTLIRGIMTAMLLMLDHSSGKVPVIDHSGEGRMEEWSRCYSEETTKTLIPVYCSPKLNERMYGQLQGLNKETTKKKFGDEQFMKWRRSFDIAPPEGESLEMTAARTLPYFNETILPALQEGKNVLIAAHGNSLRSIVMELDGLSPVEVVALEIATGVPLYYEYSDGQFKK